MSMAHVVPANQRRSVLVAVLSVLIGLFTSLAMFSLGAFVLPLAPIGIYIGIRARRSTSGVWCGFAWAGAILNSLSIALFVFAVLFFRPT